MQNLTSIGVKMPDGGKMAVRGMKRPRADRVKASFFQFVTCWKFVYKDTCKSTNLVPRRCSLLEDAFG